MAGTVPVGMWCDRRPAIHARLAYSSVLSQVRNTKVVDAMSIDHLSSADPTVDARLAPAFQELSPGIPYQCTSATATPTKHPHFHAGHPKSKPLVRFIYPVYTRVYTYSTHTSGSYATAGF